MGALVLALGMACNGSRKELSPEQMKVLVWDLSRAEAFHTYYLTRDTSRNKDRLADTLYSRVFALHKVDPERFYYTFDQFRNDPARLRVLMDSVNAYGNRMREQGYTELSDTTRRGANPARSANE
jgi:hypothetical protein